MLTLQEHHFILIIIVVSYVYYSPTDCMQAANKRAGIGQQIMANKVVHPQALGCA